MGPERDGEGARLAARIVDEAMRELVTKSGVDDLTVGAALGATAALRDAADAKLFELVGFARDAGAPWWAIGEALGVPPQAAHQARKGAVEDKSGSVRVDLGGRGVIKK